MVLKYLDVFDGIRSEKVVDPRRIGLKNIRDLSWRQIPKLNRVQRCLNHHIVEAKATHSLTLTLTRTRTRQVLSRRDVPAQCGVEILDYSECPFRVLGRNPEDFRSALVLAADTEGTLLVGIRVRVRWGFGFEV